MTLACAYGWTTGSSTAAGSPPPSVPPAVSFSTHAAALPRTLTLPCPRPQQQHAPRRGRVLNSNSCSDLVLLAACALRKTNRAHRLSFIRSFVSLFGFFRAGQGQGPARNPEGQGTGARASKGSRLLLSYRFDCDHLLPHHLCQLEPLLPAVDVLATASGQRARIPGVDDQRVTSHHLQPPS